MSIYRRTGAITALVVLIASIAASAVMAADPVYATVTGYAAGTADNNHESTWGADCTKVEDPGGSAYVLTADEALVVVKAGSGDSANTLFANASAGETVWADTNANGIYDPGGQDGDKDISHVILCPAATEPSSEPSIAPSEAPSSAPSEAPSAAPSVAPSESDVDTGGGDDEVTPPPTDTAATTTSNSTEDMLPVVLFVLFVGAILVLPAIRRRA